MYTVNRYIEETKEPFLDGSHILYVNASYRGDDAIGKLMHDFNCKNADEFNYPILTESVRHFKDGKGDDEMCEAVERYAEKKALIAAKEAAERERTIAKNAIITTAIKAGIMYGATREQIISNLCTEYNLTEEEAIQLYEQY